MTTFHYDYIIQWMNKIDCFISELKSIMEAEYKEQKEFRQTVMKFIV